MSSFVMDVMPCVRDVFRSDADAEDDGREDRQFIGYIDAFYIAGRISFRKAFFLGNPSGRLRNPVRILSSASEYSS